MVHGHSWLLKFSTNICAIKVSLFTSSLLYNHTTHTKQTSTLKAEAASHSDPLGAIYFIQSCHRLSQPEESFNIPTSTPPSIYTASNTGISQQKLSGLNTRSKKKMKQLTQKPALSYEVYKLTAQPAGQWLREGWQEPNISNTQLHSGFNRAHLFQLLSTFASY